MYDSNNPNVLLAGHVCYSNPASSNSFSYINKDESNPAGTTALIYDSISKSILASMSGARYEIGGTGAPLGGVSGLLNLTGETNFTLPVDGSSISCDASGATICTTKKNNPSNPDSLNVWASWNDQSGKGVNILLSNFKFNVLPLCQTE